ncbi:MAG: rhamnulokinase [Clostridiales bacterium]|nr:rhamnulokinase [Clostridiales bacterium]
MTKRCYLGFDFGASSGRAILGHLSSNGKKLLEIEEIHRFINEPVLKNGTYVWEYGRLCEEMKTAINKAAQAGHHIDAIGVDTWGVDFGIIGKNGELVFSPVAYRDSRTDGMMEEAFRIMPKEEIFKHTGLAFMQFNTLYQILAMLKDPRTASLISENNTLLFMPDLFEYYLTGNVGTEYTIASTGQLIDPVKRDWSDEILNAFGIPKGLFAPLKQPGTVRGMLKKELCPLIDYDVPVIAVASHDTASAVAAVPARPGESFSYISSGTWSLMGIETTSPVCENSVMQANFTNEGGLNGTTRMLKNIMGLWIIQGCRKVFNEERTKEGQSELSFADIVTKVEALAEPAKPVIDVDDPLFFSPGDMPARIEGYVNKLGCSIDPEYRVGEISDIVYRSLALKYRWAIGCIEDIIHSPIDVLYIVGGGGKNELLNRYTASALNRPVRIGAGEGTVIGNLLVQAMGRGDVKDLWELRQIVRDSFGDKEYLPENSAYDWDAAFDKLLKLMSD